MSNSTIVISNLSKKYGHTQAIENVNLTINTGGIVGLLGPNGSGKTTLIKILNGLLRDYSGSVTIDGQTPGKYTKSIISYLPDSIYFDDWMKARDAISMFYDMYEDFDIERCLNLLKRMNLNPDMLIKSMSKGMKEKMQLCLVMSRKAKIYILDEPIGGVDPAARDLILDTILNNYDPDSLVILSTHLISDIERVFEDVIFIKEGQIVLYKNAEELRQERGKSIDEIFREEFRC